MVSSRTFGAVAETTVAAVSERARYRQHRPTDRSTQCGDGSGPVPRHRMGGQHAGTAVGTILRQWCRLREGELHQRSGRGSPSSWRLARQACNS
jgi:hypothetical protein